VQSPSFIVATLLFLVLPAQAATTYYSPEEDLKKIDLELLYSAKHTIDMAAFEMTDPDIIKALYDAQARGVSLRLVFNRRKKEELRKEFSYSGNNKSSI
jgi:phosphatidylserine/phosphatidylglycerophosphate/cardiolipin synthase-like enzyme